MIADVEVTGGVALVTFGIATLFLPNSYQPKQLKVAASHKAHATPVEGSFVGLTAPAVASAVVEVLLMTTAEAGAAKLAQ